MYHIYTDGACSGNGKEVNHGGYGVVVVENDRIVTKFGKPSNNTTNNREELKAILAALFWIGEKDATIYSDSAYSLNTITTWMYSWANKGWIKSDKKVPENLDIIKVVYDIMDNGFKTNVNFVKVKGHSGELFNEIADAIASENESKLNRFMEIYNKERGL